MIITVEAIF
jgi:hypothetical protein